MKYSKFDRIPMLSSKRKDFNAKGGIHALEVNPSHNLIATNAKESLNLAIYSLPELDPVCVGINGHRDLAFDLSWLDDRAFMSVSRDNSVAIFRIDSKKEGILKPPRHFSIQPLAKKTCQFSSKLRAVAFNRQKENSVVLCFDAKVHVFDVRSFRQIQTQNLDAHMYENVCITINESCSLYAIGSKSHALLLDPRTMETAHKVSKCNVSHRKIKFVSFIQINTSELASSIRSISFQNQILTMGSGIGTILMHDIRTNKMLDNG